MSINFSLVYGFENSLTLVNVTFRCLAILYKILELVVRFGTKSTRTLIEFVQSGPMLIVLETVGILSEKGHPLPRVLCYRHSKNHKQTNGKKTEMSSKNDTTNSLREDDLFFKLLTSNTVIYSPAPSLRSEKFQMQVLLCLNAVFLKRFLHYAFSYDLQP